MWEIFGFVISSVLLTSCLARDDLVIATTTLGSLTGYKLDNGDDLSQLYFGKADIFLGVPYAKPPIGPLRFAKPEPITELTSDGTPYNATYQHDICPQLTSENVSMGEDCLFMNIFSPSISAGRPFPVMLWIHGGALRDGSARQWGVEGAVRNLVARGVVVVLIQYRLGTLGFFTTKNQQFPANLGMLDQVEAIKFVKSQIHNFGGDPDNLTLFGQSAGAASVSAHTYSPLSQNLFQQAIMESGTVMTCLNGAFQNSDNSAKIAKLICNIDLPATGEKLNALKDCMMKADFTKFLPFEKEDLLGWEISVDGYFLPDSPEKIHANRPNIPVIYGSNRDEWSFWDLIAMRDGEKTVDDYNKTSVMDFMDNFGSKLGNKLQPVLDLEVASYQKPNLADDDHVGWLQTKSSILTGGGFTSFIAMEVTWYLENNNPSVYLYEFDYYSAVGRIFQVPDWKPIPHTAELPFIWMQRPVWQKAIDGMDIVPEDYMMADFFGGSWTTFAKTGFKCGENNMCPPWKPTALDNRNELAYLDINAQKMMADNYRPVDRTINNRVLPALAIMLKKYEQVRRARYPRL